ncbi:HdeD family acid-resistance protein [Flavobacteriaceae bacterium R38]|nr:HdeD family acid-resistance protein [Flavobacteriaceae bacterium R38]
MKTFIKTVKNSVKYWFLPLLFGLVFIGIGVYTFFTPIESYLTLSLLFSASFLVSGVFEIVFSISNRHEIDSWGWSLVFGIITAITGLLLLINPEISIVTLPFYLGFLLLFRSMGAISFSLDLKRYRVLDWGNLMVIGLLGTIFSILLLWNPLFSGITIVIWTGLALISTGVFSIWFSLKLRKLK